jgi:hypothetical protein
MAGLLTAAIAGGGLLSLASPAFATQTAPAWEPDANAAAYGNITFYDAAGNKVTSGTGDLGSPFAYAVAGTARDLGATKATLYFANPKFAVPPVPSSWTSTSEAGPTNDTSLPSGTPTDITTAAATEPVVASSAASITNWLGSNTPDGNSGYANTIEVRLTDSGLSGAGNPAGTYWDSDIGYNNTASPITVDGTTVPAFGWSVLYPIVSVSTTTLTAPVTGANETVSTPVPLTATESPVVAGTMYFYYKIGSGNYQLAGTSAASASASYSPASPWTPTATGTYSLFATFVPTAGGPGSTGDGVTITVTPALIPTGSSLSVTSLAEPFGGAGDTFTSLVTVSDNSTQVGTATFFVNGSAVACTAANSNPNTSFSAVGTAGTTDTCVTASLPTGTDVISFTFTPNSSLYAPTTTAGSGATTVVVAPPSNSCTYKSTVTNPTQGNSLTTPCSDIQNIQVTINPGTVTITTPYTSSKFFTLPAMTMSSDGNYLSTSAQFPASGDQPITVTSQLSPAYPWTVSVAASDLTCQTNCVGPVADQTIPNSGLGLINGQTVYQSDPLSSITYTGIQGLIPGPDSNASTGAIGLSVAAGQTWAVSNAYDGTVQMIGVLQLFANTDTASGTYSGTITFSVS